MEFNLDVFESEMPFYASATHGCPLMSVLVNCCPLS